MDALADPSEFNGRPQAHGDNRSSYSASIPARDAGQRATIAFLNAAFHGADAELETTLADLAAEGNLVEADPAHLQGPLAGLSNARY